MGITGLVVIWVPCLGAIGAAYQIQSDVEDPRKGKKWWKNVLYIASLPEIGVDIKKEAEALSVRCDESLKTDRTA